MRAQILPRFARNIPISDTDLWVLANRFNEHGDVIAE